MLQQKFNSKTQRQQPKTPITGSMQYAIAVALTLIYQQQLKQNWSQSAIK